MSGPEQSRSAGTERPPGAPSGRSAMPSVAEAGRQIMRDMCQGLAEIGVWALAVVVVAGGLGLLGYAVGGGTGAVVGVVVGVVVLGVAWLVLLVAGLSLAARLAGRRAPR